MTEEFVKSRFSFICHYYMPNNMVDKYCLPVQLPFQDLPRIDSWIIAKTPKMSTYLNAPHGAYFDVAMATLLVPDLFYAEMAISGFDPCQTSSAI